MASNSLVSYCKESLCFKVGSLSGFYFVTLVFLFIDTLKIVDSLKFVV